MSKIIVLGSINMDVVTKTTRHPRVGETVFGHDLQYIAGGKGANQAVAAARLGDTIHLIGKLGDDAFGHTLREFLSGENLDLSRVGVSSTAPSGTAIIVVDENSDNTIIVISGSNADLTIDDIADIEISPSDIVLSQFEVPQPVIQHLFTKARAVGATTIFNTAPAQPCDSALLDVVSYLVLNETELAFYAGTESIPETPDAIIQTAQTLRANRDQTIIVTLGAQGVMCINTETSVTVPAFKVDAIDTTAAGDCFVGAFAVGLSEGQSVESALRFACGASALSVQVFGASVSLPTRSAVDKFLQDTEST